MDTAALIIWILTAGGGFVLLATWISKGGARAAAAGAGSAPQGSAPQGSGQSSGRSNLPAPLVFGHFLLAATGLVLWIVYLASDKDGVGWTAFVLLLVVALGGFAMFFRWIPVYRAHGKRGTGERTPAAEVPAEAHFPLPIVAAHGLFAATTIVVVLLAMLNSN
jgi:hypothetical protein